MYSSTLLFTNLDYLLSYICDVPLTLRAKQSSGVISVAQSGYKKINFFQTKIILCRYEFLTMLDYHRSVIKKGFKEGKNPGSY